MGLYGEPEDSQKTQPTPKASNSAKRTIRPPERRPEPIGIPAVPRKYDCRRQEPPSPKRRSTRIPHPMAPPENRLQAPLRPPPIGVLPHSMALPEFRPLAPVSHPGYHPRAAPNAEAVLRAAAASSAARHRSREVSINQRSDSGGAEGQPCSRRARLDT